MPPPLRMSVLPPGWSRRALVVERGGNDMMLPVLGIDIAKATFDACLLLPDGRSYRKVFPNTTAGFELLARWLTC